MKTRTRCCWDPNRPAKWTALGRVVDGRPVVTIRARLEGTGLETTLGEFSPEAGRRLLRALRVAHLN